MIVRKTLAMLIVMGLTMYGGTKRVWAQDSSSSKQDAPKPKPTAEAFQPPTPVHSYRLDFSINELEDGKKVNSRQYSLDVNNGLSFGGRIQAGTRVPAMKDGSMILKGDGSVNYLDVSTSINVSRVTERENGLSLDFVCDVQSPASPAGMNSPPVLRTLNISGSAVLTIGKAAVIGVADDPNSKRQFQLELTATQLK